MAFGGFGFQLLAICRIKPPGAMTSTRIPPPLEPYLSPPSPATLTLLTGVLGATCNWLVVRYLATTLANVDRSQRDEEEGGVEAAAVLVSFLRDRDFWKFEASRVVSAGCCCLRERTKLERSSARS